MNRRGIALIFSLLVVLVLSILLSAFFFKSINENNLVNRYVNSARAFWVAEAGVAEAIKNLTNTYTDGTLGNYYYNATTTTYGSYYYNITSIGTVGLPNGGYINRTVKVVAGTGTVDASKFQYALAAANGLCFGGAGSCNKAPEDFIDPDTCNGHPCWNETDTSIVDFRDLFGYEQSEVERIAEHYNDTNFDASLNNEIAWVDVAVGSTLNVTGSEIGSGLLIVNGSAHFGGTYQFSGIVYVLGTLTARGTFDSNGTVMVASTSDIANNSVNGNPDFYYNTTDITNALNLLANNFVRIVSWRETQ